MGFKWIKEGLTVSKLTVNRGGFSKGRRKDHRWVWISAALVADVGDTAGRRLG